MDELYSVNHHPALAIGQQPIRNLKGHGMFSGARSNHNRFPIFSLQNTNIGRTPKNTNNILSHIHSSAFCRNCHQQIHNSSRTHVSIPFSTTSLPGRCTFSGCSGKSGNGVWILSRISAFRLSDSRCRLCQSAPHGSTSTSSAGICSTFISLQPLSFHVPVGFSTQDNLSFGSMYIFQPILSGSDADSQYQEWCRLFGRHHL